MDRIIWIDALKGVSIILIVISHYCGIPIIGQYLFACYIQLFFIVSGYTIKDLNSNILSKRTKRIIIPYCFYGIMTCILMGIFNKSFLDFIHSIYGLIYSRCCLYPLSEENNIFLLKANNPLWFLTSLISSLFLTFIYFHIKKRHFKAIIILLYTILSIIGQKAPILMPWSIDTAFSSSLLIISGYYIKKNNIINKFNNCYIYILVLLIPIILVSYNGNINISIREYGMLEGYSVFLYIVIGIIGFILYTITLININNIKISYFFATIGKSSLRILCIHLPIYYILFPYFIGIVNNIYIVSLFILSIVIYLSIKTENKLSKYNI